MANTVPDVKFSPADGWVDLLGLSGQGKTTQVTVTWQAFVAAGTETVGDLTITATGAFTAAQVAQVAAGAVIAGLTSSGSTAWVIGQANGATNTLTSTTTNAVVAAPTGSFTGAGNSAPTVVTNVTGSTNPALTIYNKGQQPFYIAISPTIPGRNQVNPNVGAMPLGIPVYAGPIGSTLVIPAAVSGVWGWSTYESAYALLQN